MVDCRLNGKPSSPHCSRKDPTSCWRNCGTCGPSDESTHPKRLGTISKFAEQQPLPDGGRKVVLATDRPMSFREIFNQTRSKDYPFTWVQLNMRPDGTGQGELAVRARVFGDRPNRPIEVETFEIQPIKLQQVTSRKKD